VKKFFRALRDRIRTRLISELFNDTVKSGILFGDLEYKNCPLDLTLTDMLSLHSTDVALTSSTTNSCLTQL
jgi:hypothetical protein